MSINIINRDSALKDIQQMKTDMNPSDTNLEILQRSASTLLSCYEKLSGSNQHLLSPILGNQSPKQWEHYPENDVIDSSSGYQYFYHSHSPGDREDTLEHGHFHLFARIDNGKHEIDTNMEARFLDSLKSAPKEQSTNANLLCISLDAKGIPLSIFTVNRWVTDDQLLSASTTLALLKGFHIATPGFEMINQWLKEIIRLFWSEISELLTRRDLRLATLARSKHQTNSLLEDTTIEVLSETVIDIDYKIDFLHKLSDSTG